MAIVKSKLIKELKKSYPNFLIRDLDKVVEIILKEIKETLKRGEGVELRNFGTSEKISVPKKRTIIWKMSKDLFKKLNNEKE